MSEPVVIIGPANGPAGPSAEPARDADLAPAADTGDAPEKRARVASMLARLGTGVLGVLSGLFRVVGALAMGIFRRYPRHSLAAIASVLILGAIWYTEIGGRRFIANQIAGDSSAGVTNDAKKAAGTPAGGGAASSAKIASEGAGEAGVVKPDSNSPAPAGPTGTPADGGAASPAKVASTGAVDAGPVKPGDNAPAPAGPTAPTETPTPAPTVVVGDEPAPALPSLPATATAAGDLAATAKPEPAPSSAPSLDQPTPSLLASAVVDPAPAPPPAVADEVKAKSDAVKPAPAMEPPALIAALAPASTPPAEGPPALAPTREPVQLATGLDEKDKPAPISEPVKQPSSGPAPPPAAAVTSAASTEIKPKDTPAVSESKPVEKPADALKPGAVAQPTQPPAQPETTKNDAVKPDAPPHEPVKVQEPVPAAVSLVDKPKDPPAVPSTPARPLTDAKTTDAAKPVGNSPASQPEPPAAGPAAQGAVNLPSPGERAPSQLEPPAPNPAAPGAVSLPAPAVLAPAAALADSHVSVPDSKPLADEPKPAAPEPKLTPENHEPQPALQAASPEPHGSNAKPAPPETSAKASRELPGDGWVSVPNSGKIVIDDAPDVSAHREDAGSGIGAGAAATRDIRAHNAKDIDFEPESPRAAANADPKQNERRSAVAFGAGGELRSSTAAGRVEPTSHVVERLENFWTISRLYYSSGRYYRALWKANASKYPIMDKLKVNDVIVIPAVEDLDPEYIDPPRTAAPASLGTARRPAARSGGGIDSDAVGAGRSSSSDTAGEEPVSTARTNRSFADAVPVRRSSRTDPDLELPAPDAVSRRTTDPDHTGRPIHRPLGDDDDANDEPQTRSAARPRTATAASRRRPAYKVRQYDSLRSIARDMLGDSHRAGEILELNRDLIDDPAHLTVGQMLELPDDARTSVRRSASR